MDQDMVTVVAAAIGAALGVLGLLGATIAVLYKWGLLPRLLRDLGITQIADDVKATREAAEKALHEVGTNGHASAKPTLKDDVRDVQASVKSLREMDDRASNERTALRGEIQGLAKRFDDHLKYHGTASRVPRPGDFPEGQS